MANFMRLSIGCWAVLNVMRLGAGLALSMIVGLARADEVTALPNTIVKIKTGVVAIGTFQKTRRPPAIFRGTGFVVGDGLHIATNAHVVPAKLDQDKNEMIAVFSGNAKDVAVRQAIKIAEDSDHDLAILRIQGSPLAALPLGDSDLVREGEIYAFTGFPIGMVLGLNAVSHRGLIAAITPIVIPQYSAQQLEKKTLARLIAPYEVFQLDATAHPGNSGSPLYHPDTGAVVGVINKVFVQQSKEGSSPQSSGIAYAIPIKHLQELMRKNQIR